MKSTLFFVCLLTMSSATSVKAQSKPERARLPSPASLQNAIFFHDAFTQGLRGSRPGQLGGAPRAKATNVTSVTKDGTDTSADSRGFLWSSVVSARTLEDEVKSLQIHLGKAITTPSQFRGGGYLEARRLFTELAVLFSVIEHYDRDVRWKSDAALARELFTRAAANTQTTSIQAFQEAKKRQMDLEELVRGGNLVGAKTSEERSDWSRINRSALMQRFTLCYDEGLAIWTADPSEFAKHQADIRRESELLRMWSRVLTQSGMVDGDDEDYVAFSRGLEKSVGSIFQSLQVRDAVAARRAASDVGQACIACHDDYRG